MASIKNSKNHKKIIRIVSSAMFAAFIAVCGFVTIKLPTLVPITLQTAGVCITAALLGPVGSVISVAVYIALGAIGLPVFSGFSGGIGHIAGATGGFIVGFLPAAFLTGLLSKRIGRGFFGLAASMAAGVIVCYAVGCLWYVIVTESSLESAFLACVLPFLIPDALKILLSSAVCLKVRKYVVAW